MHMPEPISGTVLLIDRDDVLPKQRAIFEQAGYTVLMANNTADGLAMAREKQPNLVVSEVVLEKPDAGFVLGYRLKSAPETAQIPLILLSSIFRQSGVIFDLSSPEARRWVKADLYLDRPVTPERLLAKVGSLLQHKTAH